MCHKPESMGQVAPSQQAILAGSVTKTELRSVTLLPLVVNTRVSSFQKKKSIYRRKKVRESPADGICCTGDAAGWACGTTVSPAPLKDYTSMFDLIFHLCTFTQPCGVFHLPAPHANQARVTAHRVGYKIWQHAYILTNKVSMKHKANHSLLW